MIKIKVNLTTVILLGAIFSFLSSCSNQENKVEDGPFLLPINFVKLADSLDKVQPRVTKILITNDTSETLLFNQLDWKKIELVPFIDANFNIPKNKDSYTIDSTALSLAPFLKITYTAKDSSLPVLKASYTFFQKKLEKVELIRRVENPLYQSLQKLIYEPGFGMAIHSNQKVEKVFERKASILYQFEDAPKQYSGHLVLNDSTSLPIPFTWNENAQVMTINNAGERILITEVSQKEDTTILKLPVFQSEFRVVKSENEWNGFWYNFDKGPNYKVDFHAHLKNPIDLEQGNIIRVLAPKYKVLLGEEDPTVAIGLFEDFEGSIYGSFATETGDYRFLKGEQNGNYLKLSTFDGSHAYAFTATISENGILTNGIFYSGNHYHTFWNGTPDNKLTLTDPSKMNQATAEEVNFSLLNLAGTKVSLRDEQFSGKPLLVTIMGSWCPNCMDESRLLNQLHAQYKNQGLEIVAVAFERKAKYEKALPALKKASKDLKISYPVLFGGKLGKESVKNIFPQLDEIKSYPTLLVLDKNHRIINIHTGFYGPGTGEYYSNFVQEINEEIGSLLAD